MTYLKDKGIKTPDTELCEDKGRVDSFLTRNNFPVVMKPRYGASSQNIFIIQEREQMLAIAKAFPLNYFVVQEFLPSNKEYTVGVYVSKDHSFKKTFIIDRELKFGLSYKGEVIVDKRLSDYCLTLCSILGMSYSTNVQLKVVGGEPCVFEINPRLSSTTAVRANFGFNEPEMILWELFYNISEYTCKIRTGKFMRYWEEVYAGGK
jgi:carbamoyl-phosphate synthase large subunit